MLQRLVDLSGGWDALVGPGPWKAGPGGWWPRMRPAPSMPCSRTPAPRPAAVVIITQSFFRHPARSLGVGPCRAAPPLLILSSQSYRHRFESGEGSFAHSLWTNGLMILRQKRFYRSYYLPEESSLDSLVFR